LIFIGDLNVTKVQSLWFIAVVVGLFCGEGICSQWLEHWLKKEVYSLSKAYVEQLNQK